MSRTRFYTVLFFASAMAMAISMPVVHAADSGGGDNTNQYTLSQSTYTVVKRIQKLMGANKYGKAIGLGQSILPRVKKESPYAEALINELIANSYLIQKKLDQAEPYLKTIVQLNALQPSSQRAIVQELAAVYLENKNYNGAIRLYNQVLQQETANKQQPRPDLYYRLGLAYSYRGDANSRKSDYSTALRYIKQAIRMAEQLHAKDPKNNDAPSKDWYQSWFVMAYKLQDFKQARDVAQLLVAKWPNDKDFWSYYANTALLLHDDQQATAIYGLMYKRGMFKSKDDYMQLASLLLEQNTPYKAAEVISDGMQKGIIPKTKDNYDTLSGAWIAARDWDKALSSLSEEAKVSSNGKVYLRQAQIYLNRRDYAKAHEAAQNALNKGGLKNDAGSAWMTLGQAAFEQKDYSTAVKAFHAAEKYKSQERNARSWIKYVASVRKGG